MGKRRNRKRRSKRRGGGRKSLRKLRIRGGSKRSRKSSKRKGLSRKQVRKLQKGVAKRSGGVRRSKPSGRTDRGTMRTSYSNARYGGKGSRNLRGQDKKRAKLWKQASRQLGIKVNNENDARRLQNLVAGGALNSSRGGSSRGGSGSSSRSRYDRGSGQFQDIKGALGEDIRAGQNAASNLAGRNPSSGSSQTGRLEELLGIGLTGGGDQRVGIGDFMQDQFALQNQQFEQQLAEQNAAYADQLAGLESGYADQIAGLESQFASAQQEFASANAFMQQQLAAANAAREAADRRAYNTRNAFVPQANPTAMSVAAGDMRTTQRKKQNNQLSDLRVLSGVGTGGGAMSTAANALAGLQLA